MSTTATDDRPRGARGRDRSGALDWLGLVLRLVLGAVLIYAGATKITNLPESQMSTRAYQLLPLPVADVVGLVLPPLEIFVGLLLVVGLMTRLAAGIGALLMVVFVIGIASVWARGISIDCGCFGSGGTVAANQTRYPQEIARDAALLLVAAWLVVRPRTRLSLDRRLWG